jgi:hypothetical protein
MKEKLRFLGLDVHAETIAAAIAEPRCPGLQALNSAPPWLLKRLNNHAPGIRDRVG